MESEKGKSKKEKGRRMKGATCLSFLLFSFFTFSFLLFTFSFRMASIRLQGVDKVFPNGQVAVRGLELEVADGEFVVLVGPSGSGKTTILRIVAGLETPTCGRVFLDG